MENENLRQSFSMEIQTRNCASILGTMESPKLLEGLFDTKTIITAEQSNT